MCLLYRGSPHEAWRVLLVGLGLTACVVCGCSPSGSIHVDRPEVITRERLVQHRVRELQWLEDKLDPDAYSPTTQGYQDFRAFEGFLGQVSASFDPLGGAAKTAQSAAALADMARGQELAALKHQIDVLNIQKSLEALQEPGAKPGTLPEVKPTEPPDTSPKAEPPPLSDAFLAAKRPGYPEAGQAFETKAKLTNVELLRDEAAYRSAVHAAMCGAELDDTHDLNGYTLYTLKFDVTVVPGSRNGRLGRVQVTLPDVASRKLSLADYDRWLDALQAEMTEHAMALQHRCNNEQLTLNDLTRVVQFIPEARRLVRDVQPDRTDLAQKVKDFREANSNEMGGDSVKKYLQSMKDANPWKDPKAKQLSYRQAWALRHVQQLDIGKPAERRQLAQEGTKNVLFGKLNQALSRFENRVRLGGAPGDTVKLGTLSDVPEASPEVFRFALALLVLAEYQPDLHHFVKFVPPKELVQPDARWSVPRVDRSLEPADRESYLSILTQALDGEEGAVIQLPKVAPYVYAVEPKEYAQNISDVAAQERFTRLVLAVKAALPQAQGADIGLFTDYIKQSQLRLQAILRKPLVVGYADGVRGFGWLLGPRFRIRRGGWGRGPRIVFEHTPVQHSLVAAVAVPAWWTEMKLTAKSQWQRRKPTRPFYRSDFWEHASNEPSVALPADYSALTTFLLRTQRGERRRPPWILPLSGGQALVHAGRNEQVLVLGRDLWRNPAVFIGFQRAKNVQVLPDMRGLLASFEPVVMPARYGDANPRLDLTVVTSNGRAILPQSVVVLPPSEAPAEAPTVTPKQRMVAKNDTVLQIECPARLIPPDTYSTHLFLRPRGKQAWTGLPGRLAVEHKGKKAVVSARINLENIKSKDLKDEPQELELDVRCRRFPDAPLASIEGSPLAKTVVYLTSKDQTMAALGTDTLKVAARKEGDKTTFVVDNITVTLKRYDLLKILHEGLEQALKTRLTLITTKPPPKKDDGKGGPSKTAPTSKVLHAVRAEPTAKGVTFTVEQKDKAAVIQIHPGTIDRSTESTARSWADWLEDGAKYELKIEYLPGRPVPVDKPITVAKPQQQAPTTH